MKKEMLINVLQAEECRIAIIEDGVLEELYVERASQESYVGNIYKGRIVNIEPGIQAAFVDFGIGRNGFLHASDVDPIYYKHLLPQDVRDEMDAAEADAAGANRGTGGGGPRGRTRDRGDRPERGDRRGPRRDAGDRDDDRPVRVAEVESSVSLPAESPADVTPIDDEEFGEFGEFGDTTADAAPVAPPKPPAPKPVARQPVVKPAEPADEDEDDGFGSGLDEGYAAPPTRKPAAEVEETTWELFVPEPVGEPEEMGEIAEVVEAEARPKAKPKPKGRAKPKADEPAELTAPAAEDEDKKPAAKPRKSRKKADDVAGDEKPKPIPGAERRTTADDDEVEIRPFFTDGADADFDPDAPNDRFDGSVSQDRANEPAADEVEESIGDGDSDYAMTDDSEDGPPRRGFNEADDLENGPPRNRNDRDRGRTGGGGGDRGRGRPNDRGGDRGRPSDRGRTSDRGGDRGRPNDRGPRPAGGGGAGYGGSGGMGMGSRPMSRERTFPRPPIQEIFKRGQEVIIQVIKEAIGTKAPNLSTFISIAGRYLVLMPSLNRVGVSRKIEDVDARKRLREIMNRLNPPKGVGFIVRTAAIDRNEQELQNDLAYLLRLWQVVARRIKKMPSPVEIYRESDMITRTIRDNFTSDINTIWVDEPNAFAQASEFLQIVMPRFADRIRFFSDTEPLFNKYRVDEEIAKINNKRIDLPLGGSIIIEQTEALVAIDVNSGNFRADAPGAEETAFQVNLIAAKEIARQLRLRDLGGVIVNDFIDMRSEGHRRKVEDTLNTALKRDRARTKILRISQFGIIEMTRQRIQPSLKKRIFNECGHCKGTGYVKTNETIGIEVMRLLQLAAHRSPLITSVTIALHVEAAFYLLNRKRKEIAALEERAKLEVQIDGRPGVSPELLDFRCLDGNGSEVRLFGNPPPKTFRAPPQREFRSNDRRPPALD